MKDYGTSSSEHQMRQVDMDVGDVFTDESNA